MDYKKRRGIMAYRFEGLQFNAYDSIEMSRDLARALQRLRDVLGPGPIKHSGVYRNRPERRSQRTGEWIPGPPYTGHYFWDAIDISYWGTHDIHSIAQACAQVSVPYILEPTVNPPHGIIHIEVNRPHLSKERK